MSRSYRKHPIDKITYSDVKRRTKRKARRNLDKEFDLPLNRGDYKKMPFAWTYEIYGAWKAPAYEQFHEQEVAYAKAFNRKIPSKKETYRKWFRLYKGK